MVLKNISWRLQQRYGRPRFRAPGEVLVWINQQLIEQSAGMHVAMFLGVIDLRKHTLHYSSAAHFLSLVVADAGKPRVWSSAIPLGLFPDAKYESAAVDIAPGERVVVFSDGILELLQESDLAGKGKSYNNKPRVRRQSIHCGRNLRIMLAPRTMSVCWWWKIE